MYSKTALIVSMAGNVTLASLIAYLLLVRAPLPELATLSPQSAPESSSGSTATVDDDKVLTFARLEAEATNAQPADFWSADSEQQMRRHAEVLELQRDRIRAALVARYGPSAAENLAFTRVFKPLNTRYPYLSSKSQIGLLKLQLSQSPSSRSRPTLVRTTGQAPADFAGAEQRQLDFERAIRALLSPNEFVEYQLRESRVARQLRASGVATDEKEFRAAFAILQANADERTPAGYLNEQERLKSLLGTDRFVKLSAARDPAFAAMQSAGDRHQVSPQQLMNVYSVMLAAHNSLARLSLDPSARDRTSPSNETQQVMQQRDAAVSRIVGDIAAADLIQDYMSQVMSIDPRGR